MKKLVVGALTAVVSSIALAAPVDAQPVIRTIKPKDEYPIEIVHLVEKAASGPLSDGEVNLLKKDYPELAAVTPDYRANNVKLAETIAPAASLRAASGCANAFGTHHSRTLLGDTFYRMNTSVRFCWNSDRVTSVTNLNITFSDVSPTAEIGNVVEATARPGANGFAHLKYLVKNIIPLWGQVNAKYPHNTFTLYRGGRYDHGHGE